jgi:plasmid rolling circle replication initiator protein Rep
MIDSPSDDGSSYVYLTEISPDDKPWDVHKWESRIVSRLYDEAGLASYSKRVWECSQRLDFALKSDDAGTMRLRLQSARFCRVRWCPVCLWRKSMMWRARFIKALPSMLADHPRGRFIFLTLTVRNCELDDLRETLAAMTKAWKLLTLRKNFPAIGWLKSVEVTRGRDGLAHPHFHCLLMVNETYFKRGYLSQQTWRDLWKDCMRIDYDPMVNVKVVKNRKRKTDNSVNNGVNGNVDTSLNGNVDSKVNNKVDPDLMAGLLEVVKYTTDPDDLVADPDWLKGLTEQMHKTRAIGLGGVFKTYLSEDEPEDLIHTDLDDTELKDEDVKLIFDWAEIVRRYAKKECKQIK